MVMLASGFLQMFLFRLTLIYYHMDASNRHIFVCNEQRKRVASLYFLNPSMVFTKRLGYDKYSLYGTEMIKPIDFACLLTDQCHTFDIGIIFYIIIIKEQDNDVQHQNSTHPKTVI